MFLKHLPIRLLVLLCVGCTGSLVPTYPTVTLPPPPTGPIGLVWGYVFSEKQCLPGALVEVVEGAKAGSQSLQKECDFDSGIGYQFRDLIIGERVTLRASKPGYRSQDRQIVPSTGGPPFSFDLPKE